ncbi:uncharacterized protein [Cicer arietinum]|uniref:Uncharacterized protein LOC101508926 n=1 Tax=Cicer arietinum TaxID=3827 RepID=A0A1S2YVZ8_CICAR|nr:uncharacterized protein LOC101508926 [Cicer arietinum]XP_004510791.1 uncharacterized protein LOC101508926 [Cicer arietinum]
MSFICGLPILECVSCLACARWVWKKCLYTAGYESENWGLATLEEFEPIPRICRTILAVYEDDIRNPQWAPEGGYGINPDWIVLRKDYGDNQGRVTPYMIYLDHDRAEIILAVSGLNLGKESDYAVLLDNKLGQTEFHGGYVHNGLLKAAAWVFDAECEVLRKLIADNPTYMLTFIGHSLGAGVVALLTMLALHNRDKLGIQRDKIKCYAIAPARCMSLNLAVRYADVINSIVLQDDFLPRTTTGLESAFKSLLCWPCLLCLMCLKDTFIMEEKKLRDPRRLYAPGRLYHIVERKPFRFGRFPPVVRTAVPVDGRFDHIVLSCNATADHAILWIESESRRALDLMLEKDQHTKIPPEQKMVRQESLAREHSEEYRAALQRAVALDIPRAYSPSSYGTFHEIDVEEDSEKSSGKGSSLSHKKRSESWNEFVEHMFDVDDTGHMVFKKTTL